MEDKLYGEIGRIKMQVDWLKKTRGVTQAERSRRIERGNAVPLVLSH